MVNTFQNVRKSFIKMKARSSLLDDFGDCKASIKAMLKGQDSYILQLLGLKKSILQIEITI